MSQLVCLIVTEPDKTREVIEAWLRAGASGVIIIEARGLAHLVHTLATRDDMPLFPSLADVIQPRDEAYQALIEIVPDDFNIDGLVEATEKITGPLSDPETGILFVLPVSRVWGRYRTGEKPLL